MKGNALQHCLILRDSRQTSPLFPVGWYTSRLVVWRQVALVVGGFFFLGGGIFFPFKRRRACERSGRGVARVSPLVSGCHPPLFFFFSDTLTGKGGRRVGEGQLESKSYRRRCHVCFLGVSSPSSNKT